MKPSQRAGTPVVSAQSAEAPPHPPMLTHSRLWRPALVRCVPNLRLTARDYPPVNLSNPLSRYHSVFLFSLPASATPLTCPPVINQSSHGQSARAASCRLNSPLLVRDSRTTERIAFLAASPIAGANVDPNLSGSRAGSWVGSFSRIGQLPDAGLDR